MPHIASPRRSAPVFALVVLALCACSQTEPEVTASDVAKQPGNMAVAGPNGTIGGTESAFDRAARHNAQQDDSATGEPQLDENGNPIPPAPNQPTRDEMERAVARAEAQNN